jgi:hypothetical protein
MKLEFFRLPFEKTQISNFTKIRPVGVELFHAHRQSDRYDEAKSRFSAILRKRLKMPYMNTCIYFNISPLLVVIIEGDPSVSDLS